MRHLIDAHHHCWIPEQRKPDLGYGWLRDIGAQKPFGDPTPIQRDYLLDEFRAETNYHLQGSVHVQCDGSIPDPVAETAWVSQIAKEASFPMAIVGFLDFAQDNAAETLARHREYVNFRGVRQILSHLPDQPAISFAAKDLLADEKFQQHFPLIAAHNCLFEAQLYPEQAPALAMFLTSQPHTQMVLDHALSPYDPSDGGIARWREAVTILAEYPNMAIKLSGFGMFDAQWTAESIKPLIDHILAKFGTERVLFGSNFPVEKLASNYDDTIKKITQSLDGLSAAQITQIFAENARRLYRL